jgi:hypothetical protein
MTEPLQQKDMFTKRWRRVRALDPKESQIQIQLVAELKLRCRKGVVYFHVPNGEERNDKIGAKLKAMGTLRGVADLVFFWCERDATCKPPATHRLKVLFLELKRRDRRMSLDQWAFAEAIREAGAFYDMADSVGRAFEILDRHGLLKQ